MLTETDAKFLRLAYEEAKAGFEEGGCPIGAVLARGGFSCLKIISTLMGNLVNG